jgi:hypothetical protein
VCPTQWDETMKATDRLFGSPAKYNKAMQAAYHYTVVPYQTAEAGCGVEVLGGCAAARPIARSGGGA